MSSNLLDILDPGLIDENQRIIIERLFSEVHNLSANIPIRKTTSVGEAVDGLLQFYDLVRLAVEDIEERSNASKKNKVIFTEESPNEQAETDTIAVSLVKRLPGAFSQGPPMGGNVKNLRHRVREVLQDPDHPTYKIVVKGYFYDCICRFTCWGRTNKEANVRAEWFRSLMEEYAWFFSIKGVNRVFFQEQHGDIALDLGGNRWYGRPIDYFVRFEDVRVYSEKELERLVVKVGL